MDQNAEILKKAIAGSLKIIEQDREKEIISRRLDLMAGRKRLNKSEICCLSRGSVFVN